MQSDQARAPPGTKPKSLTQTPKTNSAARKPKARSITLLLLRDTVATPQTGMTQSQVLLSLDRWIDHQADPVASTLRTCRAAVTDQFAGKTAAQLQRLSRRQSGDQALPNRMEQVA